MDRVFEIIFLPLQPFLAHPEWAYLPVSVFAVICVIALVRRRAGHRMHFWLPAATTLTWVFFGIVNYYSLKHGWNIRVDLLVLGPLILVLTVLSVVFFIKDLLRREHS